MQPLTAQPCHLIVFGRYPEVGRTKTRLIPALGPAGAAALQKRLTEKTVAAALAATAGKPARLVFCHAGGNARLLERWLGDKGVAYLPQTAGDLGHRMYRAMQAAFDQGARRVVLVGTDIPGITEEIFKSAFDGLKQNDLVLGPSTDGGYWLVGMSRLRNLFDGIAWSRPDVLQKTLSLAGQNKMKTLLLDPLTDLDTPADLAREPVRGLASAPYLSVVVPTLNEEKHIASTLDAAASLDAEIIVSDGGSTDRTVEIARKSGARVVIGARGRAAQQNRGAAVTRGEVLLFLHADTRLPSAFVNHIFDTLMDRRTVLGAFRFATDVNTSVMRWIAFWTNLRSNWLQLPYGDQGLFIRKSDFNEIRGFPVVPIAEDLYLARQMNRKGRIAIAQATAVTSGRRWQQLGALRTTLINTVIAAGCLAGIPPSRLASLYGQTINNEQAKAASQKKTTQTP